MTDGTGYRASEDGADGLSVARTSAIRRRGGWPRRALSGHVAALMWMLRLYVVGMLAVVAVQLVRLV